MKRKNTRISIYYVLIGLGTCMFASSASADDDHGQRVRITGTSSAIFTQDDQLGFSQGRAVGDVALSGSFEITAGDVIRTGRFTFPHLLVANLGFPSPSGPPIFLDGHVTGAAVWFFDDGVVCDGALAGDFDETGGNLVTKGKLKCTDGTRLKLSIRDVEVIPGVSVSSKIRGKLIFPKHDD